MDELRVIERAAPVRPVDDEVLDRARARLRHEFVAPRSGTARRRMFTRRVVALQAAAVLALALALVAPAITGEESEAAATLRGLGQVAERQPFTPIEPGQYLYTESRALVQSCTVDGCHLERVNRRSWIGPDGSGRLVQDGPGAMSERFGPGGLHFEDLMDLPTDPVALKAYIEERAGDSGPSLEGETFVIVGDLLRETHGTPALRAALFEVAAGLPDSVLIGETTDHLGRPGIGVGYEDDGNLEVLIFDPATGSVLGERTETPEGEVVGWRVVVRSAVVDSVADIR